MKSKKIITTLLTLILLITCAQPCMAEASDYDKIKTYINSIAPTGEITISELVNTLKVGTTESNLKDEDIKVNRGNSVIYTSTLDMSPVKNKYESIIAILDVLDSDLKEILNNSDVTGQFIITITYDKNLKVGSLDDDGFTSLNAELFDADNIGITYPDENSVQITVNVKPGNKASNIAGDKLSDITYKVSNVKVDKDGGPYAVTVNMNGYVSINTDGQEAARINFSSPDTVRSVTGYTSSTGSSSGGSTGGTTTLKRTVTFDTNGGSVISKQIVENGKTVSAPANPTKAEYKFDNWYIDAGLTELYDFNTKVTSDITLYAKWIEPTVEDKSISVIVKGSETKEIPLNNNKTVDLSKLETPSRDGFIFDGWYTEQAYQNKLTEDTVMENNQNIYGRWINARVPDSLDDKNHIAYVMGYPDGTVRPEINITREEIATIFYRLLKEENRNSLLTDDNDFTDISSDKWSNTAISTIAAAGFINGYEDGTFKPENPITRAEFAAIISRMYGDIDTTFAADFDDIQGHWAANEIKKLSELECINGYEDNTVRPEQLITRAESMAIINRVLVRYVDADGLHDNINNWSDNDINEWYYYPVLEATNAHNFERIDNSYLENWSEVE